MLFGKYINKYYIKYGLFFLLGVVTLVFVDWIQLYIPEYLGKIIDILDINHDYDQITVIAFKIVIIGFGMFVGRVIWRFALFYAAHSLEDDLRRKMFAKAEKLSRQYYHNNKVGTIMAWFTNDLESIVEFFGWGTCMLVDAFFLSILVLIKMFNLDLVLTLFALIPIILIAIWGALVEQFMVKNWIKRQESYDKVYDFSQENFTGIRVIKAFVKENKEIHAFAKVAKQNADMNIKFVRLSVLFDILITIIISAILSLILGFGGYFAWCVINGTQPFGLETSLTAAKLVTFIGYFNSLIWPMIALGQIVTMLARCKASSKRITEFLDTPEEVKSPENAVVLKDVRGDIEFKNFSFRYPTRHHDNLKEISLSIKAGESVGIVGRIGSGKSTIVNILLYLYNLNEGQVFIDGVDLSTCDIDSIRENIAYVPQDNFLFSDSIKNNILFGMPDGSIDDAIAAAKFSAVDDNIQEFTEGYETVSGERGVTLSGGQKQRISIARAFVKHAPIMIMDDSVSAVDTKTEEIILNNIMELRKGQTTLVVASRVSTVFRLDKIIVLNEGRLEAFGSPEELSKTSPTYQKMVYLQQLEAEITEGGNK